MSGLSISNVLLLQFVLFKLDLYKKRKPIILSVVSDVKYIEYQLYIKKYPEIALVALKSFRRIW